MKKMGKIRKTITLLFITMLFLPYNMVLASGVKEEGLSNKVSEEVETIRYAEGVGYYTEKPINQGLEFEIIGECTEQFILDKYGSEIKIEPTRGSFNSPTDVITYNNLTGVWWGGIIYDVNIAGGGAVSAVTIATSSNTQSKASVRPGLTANWYTGDWQNQWVRSDVMKPVGIAGNVAAWDLR